MTYERLNLGVGGGQEREEGRSEKGGSRRADSWAGEDRSATDSS